MSTRKSTTNPIASSKPSTNVAATNPADPDTKSVNFKKPELIERVILRTDLKKRDVKAIIEATFAVLSEALDEGSDLNLPPLGKVRIIKSKDIDDGAKVFTTKIRTMKKPQI